MAAAIEQYEKETSSTAAPTDDQDDPLSRNYLRWLAKQVERARSGVRDLDQTVALVAEEFSLLDARILRTAAEVITAATPDLVMKHFGAGMPPPAIAKELGLTDSRIYGIIREARKGGWTDPVAEGHAAYQAVKDSITNVTNPDAAEAYLAGVRTAIVQDKPKD
jgi:hypothetical protein